MEISKGALIVSDRINYQRSAPVSKVQGHRHNQYHRHHRRVGIGSRNRIDILRPRPLESKKTSASGSAERIAADSSVSLTATLLALT